MKSNRIGVTVLALAAAAAGGGLLIAQSTGAVPPGQIACNFLGRLEFDEQRHARYVSYFTSLHGFTAAELFSGSEATDATARFTIVSTPVRLELSRSGPLITGRTLPVTGDASRHRVYFNEFPSGRSLEKPETFAQGQLVATFKARNTSLTAIPLLTAQTQAILELESAQDFTFQGRRVNLAQIGSAVRAHFYGGPTPAARSDAPTLAFPVSGYAVAIVPSPATEQ